MLKQGALLRELQSIVGKKHAEEPKNEFNCTVDGLTPKAVVEPGTYEEVAEALRFANTERLAVIPRGSGGQVLLGNIPSRYDIALSLQRLEKVIELQPADLTVTCQAGITVGGLSELLGESGQMAPLTPDDGAPPPLTVGGLLALNTGYSRLAHGNPRDLTMGLTVVTADGKITRAGGKVVKNVAGYDLCKLYIGSRGTLAVIVEATLKVFPRPKVRETASFRFDDCADACRVAAEGRARGMGLVEARVVCNLYRPEPGHREYALHLKYAGEPGAVQRTRLETEQLALQSGHGDPGSTSERIDLDGSDDAGHPLSVRAYVLPTKVPAFVQAMEETDGLIDAAPLLGEVTWLWVKAGDQRRWIDLARATAERLGGTLEVQYCSPELKRQIDVFGPPPPSFPLMRAIKQQFDPNNVLSPGRFVGRL